MRGFFVVVDGQGATGSVGSILWLLDMAPSAGRDPRSSILPNTFVISSNLAGFYYSRTELRSYSYRCRLSNSGADAMHDHHIARPDNGSHVLWCQVLANDMVSKR